jgi:hypothetical protein
LLPTHITELLIFDPCSLTSDSVVQFAIRELETGADSFGVDAIINHLIARPVSLAFVIAGEDFYTCSYHSVSQRHSLQRAIARYLENQA